MYKLVSFLLTFFVVCNICYGDDICSLPLKTGPCTAIFKRYGYVEGQGCIEFTYGGCDGNANNFKTLSSCIAACG
ncbi:trypsin inhibitor-like isoform X2 [Galleria mellonella]|uniref:Trypsin inhibitor-like isoform X2 n=1 Tax=Galleria mellonella TaxID=7137 RepID=A0A6J1X3G1_GALME|nr:trypsin inhibitor-like isoform X2 [Galleria mellonella]